MTSSNGRRITANLTLTLDGRYHGPGGPADFGMFMPYVTTDVARDHLDEIHENATTAVLGRVNAEGFMGYWPPVAHDESANPHDRAYAAWLTAAEKVVFSTTLTEAPWERTRMVNAPVVDVITELKAERGGNGADAGDILVNCSASLIKPLLAADLVDRLYLMVLPEIAGGGARLFDDGLPASSWTLANQATGKLGELAMTYDRVRS